MESELTAPDFGDWIDRFKSAPRDRRQAMLEAVAWKIKAGGEQLTRQLGERLKGDFYAIEDLLYFTALAFIPPVSRTELVAKLAPIVVEHARDRRGTSSVRRVLASRGRSVGRLDVR